MLPHLGAGVGQGLEDVYTLFRLLSHPTTTKSNLDVLYKHHLYVNSFPIDIIAGHDKGLRHNQAPSC